MKKTIFLLSLCLFVAVLAEENCVQYADLIFILDSSDTISELWDQMKDFIINIINRIDISPGNVRVGLVVFADFAEVELSLGQISDKNRLINEIRNVMPVGGFTNLQAAMEKTAEQFEKLAIDRSGTNDIVVILTDASIPTENTATLDAIDRLKNTNEGVYIIPIAVSDDVKVDWLELMVNNPGVPESTPILQGVDYFIDSDLAAASLTIEELFNRKLNTLLCSPQGQETESESEEK